MTQPGLFTDLPPARAKKRETPVTRELQRRERNVDRVLARLKAGPATTVQLIEVGGCRAPARVWELKRKGYAITVTHVEGGLYVYELKGER